MRRRHVGLMVRVLDSRPRDTASSPYQDHCIVLMYCFRCDHACTVAGEKFYIMGGSGGEKLWYNDVHVFDTGVTFC